MKDSPLLFQSHNVGVVTKWKAVESYPGFISSEATPLNTWRAYSIKNVPIKGAKDLVVLEDKYGQLSNPINSIAKLHKAGKREGVTNITALAATLGVMPAHFNAVSPHKATQPNALYHYGGGDQSDAFFVTYESNDTDIMLNGSLHCAYATKKGAFDYMQISLGNIDRSTLGILMEEICANLKKQLK
jgi:hypothetical protein